MEEGQKSKSTEKKSEDKNKWLLLIGALAALLILGGGFYYYMNKPVSTTSENNALTPTPGEAQVIQAQYACADDKTISAKFNNNTDMSADLTFSDGTTVNLALSLSGSGARYANSDESIVFWTQGNTAFLEENGVKTYSDCVIEPQS